MSSDNLKASFERATLFDNPFYFDYYDGFQTTYGRVSVNRPREYGIRFTKRWGGGRKRP